MKRTVPAMRFCVCVPVVSLTQYPNSCLCLPTCDFDMWVTHDVFELMADCWPTMQAHQTHGFYPLRAWYLRHDLAFGEHTDAKWIPDSLSVLPQFGQLPCKRYKPLIWGVLSTPDTIMEDTEQHNYQPTPIHLANLVDQMVYHLIGGQPPSKSSKCLYNSYHGWLEPVWFPIRKSEEDHHIDLVEPVDGSPPTAWCAWAAPTGHGKFQEVHAAIAVNLNWYYLTSATLGVNKNRVRSNNKLSKYGQMTTRWR